MSINRCRARRNADKEANFDNEGALNEARIAWELESSQVADAARRAEWGIRARVITKVRSLVVIIQLTYSPVMRYLP